PIVFVVVVFGGLGSLAGCFLASLIMGLVQTYAVVLDVSFADLLARLGFPVTSATPLAEVLTMPLPRVGALLPYLMLILVRLLKPRGLRGTRDTWARSAPRRAPSRPAARRASSADSGPGLPRSPLPWWCRGSPTTGPPGATPASSSRC